MHYFPQEYARKDFPLLFPKSSSDEAAIHSIAQQYDVDYDGLRGKLDLAQVPVGSRQVFRQRFNDFQAEYRALRDGVRDSGEQYGIELSKYAIHKPKPKIYFPLLYPKDTTDEEAIRLIATLNGIDYDALVKGSKLVEPSLMRGRRTKGTGFFRMKYGELEQIVLLEGEKHGINPGEYGIRVT